MKLALDFRVTTRMLTQIEDFYNKEPRSCKLILDRDNENPSKMSFREPPKPKTKIEISDPHDLDEIAEPLLPDQSSPDAANSKLKNKDSKAQKSLKGLLTPDPKNEIQSPLSTFSKNNSALFPKFLADKNKKVSESQNLDVDDLHSISQSTETQTQSLINLNKDLGLPFSNSPQSLVWKKYDGSVSYVVRNRRSPEERGQFAALRGEEQSPKRDFLENEIHAQKIPSFQLFAQKSERKSPYYHCRQRSNSYTEPKIQYFSPYSRDKTPIHNLSVESNSSSFLTEKPAGEEEGYLNDELKEELQRTTEVFSPKVHITILL